MDIGPLVGCCMWLYNRGSIVGRSFAIEMRDEIVREYGIADDDWNEQCDRLARYQDRTDRTVYDWNKLKL